jgi:hypothetical protein
MRPVFCGVFIACWTMTIVVELPAPRIFVVQMTVVTHFVVELLVTLVSEVYQAFSTMFPHVNGVFLVFCL